MTRIAVLDDRFHQVYGAQRNALLLARLLAQGGHEVSFHTTAEGPLADAARAEGLDVAVLEAPAELRVFEKAALSGGLAVKLRTAVALARYNRALGRALAADGVEVAVPAAVRPALHLLGWRAVGRATRRRRRLVLFAQNNTPFGLPAAAAGLTADRVGLIGPDCLRTFPSWAQGRIRPKTVPLPSGRDLARFARPAAPTPSPTPGPVEVVTVANIEPRKGIDRVIDALADPALAGRCHLTVVGGPTGPKGEALLTDLEARAHRLGVSVTFVGWCDDVVPHLHAAELMVLASSEEGLPGVLIEAMAAGLPCVTSAAGNAGDLVTRCEGGAVVPVGDTAALAGALARFVDDAVLRAATGARAAELVAEHYDLAAFARHAEAAITFDDTRGDRR
ncbi:MAG: glycosyltransferase family 4 protein [Acidimicrobiales bacterium]